MQIHGGATFGLGRRQSGVLSEDRPLQCWPTLVLHGKHLGALRCSESCISPTEILMPSVQAVIWASPGDSSVQPRMRTTDLVRVGLSKTTRQVYLGGSQFSNSVFSISLSLAPSIYPILLEPALKVIPNKVLVEKDLRMQPSQKYLHFNTGFLKSKRPGAIQL